MISGSCEDSGEAADVGDEQPCLGTLDGFPPIPRQTAAATEPCEGPLDDPSAGQHLEAPGVVGALHDL